MENNYFDTLEKNKKQIWNVYNAFSNPNILINSDFRINQRGMATYQGNSSSMTYSVDRWCLHMSDTNILNYTWDKSTLLCTSASEQLCFGQIVDVFSIYKNKPLTFSLNYSGLKNGGLQLVIYTGKEYVFGKISYNQSGTLSVFTNFTEDCTSLSVWIKKIGNDTKWQVSPLEAKLEVGNTPTLIAPYLYEEEIRKCRKYYQKIDAVKTRIFREDANTLLADLPVIMRRTPAILSYTNWYIRIYLENLVDSWCWQNTIIESFAQYSNSLTLKFTCVNHGIGDGHLFMENLVLDAEIY